LFRPDLSQASFETVGLFDRKGDILTGDLILMTLPDARDLFAISEGLVTDLLVYVANPNEIETIAVKISEKLPGSRVITRNQILKTYKVVFNWRSGLGTICLLTALAAFVILAWDKASGLSQEEMKEVGILKILGWQTNDIIFLRFCESLSVSFLAFLTGYLLAWMHVAFLGGTLFRPVFLGWSVVRPVFSLVPPFAVEDLLLVFSISVIPYLCATAVPAWRAATVRADSVI
jgi:ABC-type lipoprotein release transport system permease subunit